MEEDNFMNLENLANPLMEIAEKASEAILKIYGTDDFQVQSKDDDSPLTAADMAAHNLIIAGLAALTPNIPVLSEESKGISQEERQSWSMFWLVDPLDGTKEFIKRNGEFTVNIALVENGAVVMGVVHAPILETTYYGIKDKGSFKKLDGKVEQISVKGHEASQAVKLVASRSHAGEETVAFIGKLELAYPSVEAVSKGSSLKLCLVAEGVAHIYPRFGPTMEWDTAAAHCVAEQAGATVTNMQGEPLRYNKDNLLNPYFVINSNIPWQDYL